MQISYIAIFSGVFTVNSQFAMHKLHFVNYLHFSQLSCGKTHSHLYIEMEGRFEETQQQPSNKLSPELIFAIADLIRALHEAGII